VFQLPQLGQRPIQRGLVSPQLEQTYTVFNFGSFILGKLLRFVCVIHYLHSTTLSIGPQVRHGRNAAERLRRAAKSG
jgi:hypothetical protein